MTAPTVTPAWPDLAKDRQAFKIAKEYLGECADISTVSQLAQEIKIGRTLIFTVPLLPPSVNHYKVGRFHNSSATRAYIDAVCIFSRKTPVLADFYEVTIHYFIAPAEFLRWDTNNFWKVAMDALATAGVIRDDRYVIDEHASKRQAADERDARTVYLVTGARE
jgi:Holliday junction resolvase RusA-like endonuclease